MFINDKKKIIKGEFIFKEGEIGDKFYLLKKGKVKVLKNKKIIREIEEGSCFGELSLLINEPCSATVETNTSRNAAEKQKILIKYILKEKRVLLKLAHHL